jgi:hypothetical protein
MNLLSILIATIFTVSPAKQLSQLEKIAPPAQPLSTLEKIKRVVYLAQPYSVVHMIGKDVTVNVYALDRYPITDTAYYNRWETFIAGVIYLYLGDSTIDNLNFCVLPTWTNDDSKGLWSYFNMKSMTKPPFTTLADRMTSLLMILPLYAAPHSKNEIISLELSDQSVQFMANFKAFFSRPQSYQEYRITLSSVIIDFVLNRKDDLYRIVQVYNKTGDNVTVSEAYDVNCRYMRHALDLIF